MVAQRWRRLGGAFDRSAVLQARLGARRLLVQLTRVGQGVRPRPPDDVPLRIVRR
jgi:hypothetical protein